jgi:hypothetical protein
MMAMIVSNIQPREDLLLMSQVLESESLSMTTCNACYRRKGNTFYQYHYFCAVAVRKWCSIRPDNKISLKAIVSILLRYTRPLIDPRGLEDHDFLWTSFIYGDRNLDLIDRQFSIDLLRRFPRSVTSTIWSYLAPFPGLNAVAQTEQILQMYEKKGPTAPSVSYVNTTGSRKVLYVTFAEFRGRRYLSSISSKTELPIVESDVRELVGSNVVVCRDHFAVVDILSSSQISFLGRRWPSSTYYSILDVESCGTGGVSLSAHSDVRASL